MAAKKYTVTLTHAEAAMLQAAAAYYATMYEQGDMEGMRSPRKLAAEAASLDRARSRFYEAGFRW